MKGDNFWGRAVRAEAGLRKSKEKQTEFFFILFEITKGEYLDADGKRQSAVGKRFGWDGWLTEGSKERTLQALIFCGLDVRGGATLQNPVGIDKNEVPLTLEEEVYEDPHEKGKFKSYTRVAWVNDPARATSIHTPMDEAESTVFSQKMQGELESVFAKMQKGAGAPKQTAAEATRFDFGANAPQSPTNTMPANTASAASAQPDGSPAARDVREPAPQATEPSAKAGY